MTEVKFNNQFFDTVLRTAPVQRVQEEAAQRVLARARADAPVDSGAYKRGLRIRKAERGYRTAYLVEGTDEKTLLIEAQRGTLARALKSVGRG